VRDYTTSGSFVPSPSTLTFGRYLISNKRNSLTSLVVECDQSTDASLLALRQTEAAQHRQPPPVLESER